MGARVFRRGVVILWVAAGFVVGVDWRVDAFDLPASAIRWLEEWEPVPEPSYADSTDDALWLEDELPSVATARETEVGPRRHYIAFDVREQHASQETQYAPPAFNPIDLRVLEDIIAINGLTEASSDTDRNDGDGVLEPLELGRQTWRNHRLQRLALGPDEYSSYGYAISTLPESIADLADLRALDLHSNRLSELPSSLGSLANLVTLRLFNNRLGELPDSIGGLHRLRVLVLSRNQLTELPESLIGLQELRELHIDDNPITELPEWIASLVNLRRLNLSRTHASDTAGLRELPDTLASAPKLEALHLDGNSLFCLVAEALPDFLTDGTIRAISGLTTQRCEGFDGSAQS